MKETELAKALEILEPYSILIRHGNYGSIWWDAIAIIGEDEFVIGRAHNDNTYQYFDSNIKEAMAKYTILIMRKYEKESKRSR